MVPYRATSVKTKHTGAWHAGNTGPGCMRLYSDTAAHAQHVRLTSQVARNQWAYWHPCLYR